MKFLTIDLYNDSDDIYKNHSVLSKAAYQRYTQHLKDLENVLPGNVLELANLPGMDDGLVVEVNHDRDQKLLKLTMRCGDLQMGYYDLVLQYGDAEISLEEERTLARIARTTESAGRHTSDVCFHEIYLTTDGRIEHRWLFHPGIWFAIRCQRLSWDKIARPDRNLPRMKDRFPGGPTTNT